MAKRERIPTQKQLEKLDHISQAHKELHQLFMTWLEEYKQNPTLPIRAIDALHREVKRIEKEIAAGKLTNIAERFAEAKELALAATLPKRRVTYLRTLDSLQELIALSREWYQAEPHSKQDQAQKLRQLRRLTLEIAAGHIEDLAGRFHQAAEQQQTETHVVTELEEREEHG
jgi:hypothetical protein